MKKETRETVKRLVASGNRIDAIKAIREATTLSLKAAIDLCYEIAPVTTSLPTNSLRSRRT